MMFHENLSQKGKNVIIGTETAIGNVIPRQLPNGSFHGSGYFSGGFRHADQTLNHHHHHHHTGMNMMNSNGYEPDEFDLSEKLSRMTIGNGFSDDYSIPRFEESSIARKNPSVFNNYDPPGFLRFKDSDRSFFGNPLNINLNHSENYPYSKSHYYNGENPFLSMMGCAEAFNCEGSIVLDGNLLNHSSGNSVQKNSCNKVGLKYREENIEPFKTYPESRKFRDSGSSFLSFFRSKIHLIAKDQQGCRFLQSVLVEGTYEDLQILFNGMISHIVELMMDPFGNYLVQKLLEICDDQQRWKVVIMVTKVPGDLVRISLNTHGTRAVQKLIETLTNREQIALVVNALNPGFIDLVKDTNGNHVIQHCLERFSRKDNEFIFASATRFCVDIATHQHGCCVMNRCILHSDGNDREKLISKVASNGLILAQDAFGNYVVQLVIELKIPSAAATLLSQFEGNYVFLSTQKFSSHVVEKCLKFLQCSHERIVSELLLVPRFDQLLKDPFANYVIQSALHNTKGILYELLEKEVSSRDIPSNIYCKKLLSLSRSRK